MILQGCGGCGHVEAQRGRYPFSPGRPARRCPDCGAQMRYVTAPEAAELRRRASDRSHPPALRWRDEPVAPAQAHVVAVEGEVDLLDTALVAHRLLDAGRQGATRILLDVSGVWRVDPALASAVRTAASRLEWRNAGLAVVAPPGEVHDLLADAVGADVPVVPTREEALRALGAAGAVRSARTVAPIDSAA